MMIVPLKPGNWPSPPSPVRLVPNRFARNGLPNSPLPNAPPPRPVPNWLLKPPPMPSVPTCEKVLQYGGELKNGQNATLNAPQPLKPPSAKSPNWLLALLPPLGMNG